MGYSGIISVGTNNLVTAVGTNSLVTEDSPSKLVLPIRLPEMLPDSVPETPDPTELRLPDWELHRPPTVGPPSEPEQVPVRLISSVTTRPVATETATSMAKVHWAD